ncbi:MAG: hypothetical protein JKP98_24770 [Rhodobacteraceae bacterium]|jgi:hypothetical protein|nr:hypothetical protein [Paracoccaceae bacterium]MBL4559109.1 hypothetical protein [Paracoccaceae bacterium]HBG99806.1 hypothetical protein [Paracoccaceae bacterium]
MIKDRYGKALFSEDAVAVFDTALDYDSELFEDTVGWKLRDFDRDKYAAAYEVDFGAGADWPMVAYEVLGLIPYSAVAAAFFMGNRIEKSVLAWKRMASTLLSRLPKDGFTDANGAALLALERLFEHSGSTSAQLIAYTWMDEEAMFYHEPDKAAAAFEVIKKMDEIQPREQQFGVGLHSAPTFLFKFKADDRLFLAAVKAREVKLLEL